MEPDPRLHALCSARSEGLFHSVTHQHQIWLPDPFDVETIHQEARDGYRRLLHRVAPSHSPDAGRILLLLGDSGAGKTHLMRALRNTTHTQASGYFSYMQMTSAVPNYARYVLRQTIDSLDKPYCMPMGATTGLLRLSNALVENTPAVTPAALELLRSGRLSARDRRDLIDRLADRVLKLAPFRQVDLDLVRALLFLQSSDPAIDHRVFRFLRCEPLAQQDQQLLGGLLAPRTEEDDPQRMLVALAQLIQALGAGALVICLDQLEDILQMEAAEQKFRNAIRTVVTLAEVPNVIAVIACLADFYTTLRQHMSEPQRDRLEKDPAPVKLIAERSAEEVALLIARRVSAFLDEQEIPGDAREPLFPFPPDTPSTLARLPTRHILDWCRERRDQGFQDLPVAVHDAAAAPPAAVSGRQLEQAWNDHLTGIHPVPETEAALLRLLDATIAHGALELTSGHRFTVLDQGDALAVEIANAGGVVEQRLLVAPCQKSALGGALEKQIAALAQRAGGRVPVAVRSTAFPSNPRTRIAERLGQFVAAGGRRVVVADSDWRAMAAMPSFLAQHGADPAFPDWLRADCPLTRLPALRDLLALHTLQPGRTEPARPAEPTPPARLSPPPAGSGSETGRTPRQDVAPRLGETRDFQPRTLSLVTASLVRHAAFLGGSGSGKTTLALHLIEQLLLQGIPALLVDRKGDLCSYARPQSWRMPAADAARQPARDALRSRIEVALYTPGASEGRGRPLGISIAPPGLGELPSDERQQLAQFSASALGGLMNYRTSRSDQQRLAILGQAIGLLAELEPGTPLDLERLMAFVATEDPLLVNAVGHLDTRNFKRLAEDLQTLSLHNGKLFRHEDERLDIATLLGRGAGVPDGRTRLTIVSTAFLGSNANVLFWVAQLLLEIGRYATRHPSDALQTVILFDEADLYLPAQSKPATKEPLENLLRRARSAGIGLLLATQSPGDLDYRSRDQISSWFVGKIKEETALRKLKPMLSEAKTDVTAKLPHQAVGEFYLIRDGEVASLRADQSLIRAAQIPAEEILALAART
ncbi:AAA family ATPase [uncultured Thiocystis sp.]|jgi:DNA helicase HerA-like ATPase|uniref:AAA family ATPase n=1 Tax=uncultured Thiocystis sp. TaxID=1202134 RepID=UPI0025F19C0C|nr:AAA family ATPase [uncultured Thiocystis sp.]